MQCKVYHHLDGWWEGHGRQCVVYSHSHSVSAGSPHLPTASLRHGRAAASTQHLMAYLHPAVSHFLTNTGIQADNLYKFNFNLYWCLPCHSLTHSSSKHPCSKSLKLKDDISLSNETESNLSQVEKFLIRGSPPPACLLIKNKVILI